MKKSSDESPSMMKRLLKFVLILLLIAAPIVVLVTIFRPIASRSNDDRFQQDFSVTLPISSERMMVIIRNMSRDPAFSFYFQILETSQIGAVVEELLGQTAEMKTKDEFRAAIAVQKEKVETLAVLFANLDYPEGYYGSPETYPELNQVLREFMEEEFQLTMMGLMYRATYLPVFSFDWRPEISKAALKAQDILIRLHNEKR